MYVQKVKPGMYTVWIGTVCVTFKKERDAERFCAAVNRSVSVTEG
jgi:hypothetical protein